jgi:hypothetical protein
MSYVQELAEGQPTSQPLRLGFVASVTFSEPYVEDKIVACLHIDCHPGSKISAVGV